MDDVMVLDAIRAMGARTRGEDALVDTRDFAAALAAVRRAEAHGGVPPALATLGGRLPDPVKDVLRRLRHRLATSPRSAA